MGDDITIGVTEIVNNIEVTAQPNDQIVDISVIDNADDVTLNITPTVIEINVNKGSSYAKWGTILGTLSDQTDLQDALDLKADLVDGKVPSSQLPSYVDDVIEVANYASLPVTGETGKIYITLDNNKVYRWSGSVYIEIAANNAVWGSITGTLSNQTDLQNALNAKANISGQVFTGAISATNLSGTNTGDQTLSGLGGVPDSRTLTINGTTYDLTANRSWTITAGVWGQITGTLSNQTDLQAALDAKVQSVAANAPLGSSGGTSPTISITQATTSSDGYLSSTDWNTFNNKQPSDADLTAIAGLSGNAGLLRKTAANTWVLDLNVYATTSQLHNAVTIGTANGLSLSTQVLSLGLASTSTTGALSSTDWNIFNNKQNALTNPITGTGTTNYLSKFTGANTLGNSSFFDNGGIDSGITNASYSQFILKGNGSNDVGGGVLKFSNQTKDFAQITGETESASNGMILFRTLKSGSITEAMRITSGGNVGIGTTSPGIGSLAKLEIYQTTSTASVARLICATSKTDTAEQYPLYITSNESWASNPFGLEVGLKGNATTSLRSIYFQTVNVNSSNDGNLLLQPKGGKVGIGTTSPSSKFDVVGGSWVSNMIADDAVGNSIFIRFNTSVTSNIGSITRVGSTSAVLYNTTSDYRLKEDFKNYSGLDLISNINTYDFKWKNSEDRMYGVIAHELKEVVPYAVNGEKDAEQMQQVDYSKLVPILVNAIKELKAEIEILKNK